MPKSPASSRGAASASPDMPSLSESDGIRYLHFSTEWVQGAMRMDDPAELVLEYTAQMMGWLLFLEPPRDGPIGLLGLGAGSLARFCLKHTRSDVTVVEWNPRVTSVCHLFFRLPRSPRLAIHHDDAGQWVVDPANAGTCPVLLVDLYDAQAQGPVRDSIGFYMGCRQVLGDVGMLAVNLFGKHESFSRNIDNLGKVFDGRIVLLPEIDAGNRIVLAFNGPDLRVGAADLMARAEVVESTYGLPARRWAKSLMQHAVDGVLHF